jgi:UDP-glucose 4-epimerase
LSNQTLLILGSSGFIGSYLLDYFQQHFHTFGLQKRSDSNPSVITSDLKFLDKIKFIKKPNILINCATPNNNTFLNYSNNEIELKSRSQLLEKFIHQNKIEHFINLSTIQVYGTELSGVYLNNSKIKIESEYAGFHFLNEELLSAMCKKNKITFTNLRLSNVIGIPNFNFFKRYTLVPYCFLDSAFKKRDIILNSSGNQIRNYILLSEIAVFILSLLNGSISLNQDNNFNLVSKRFLKIIDIAYLFKKIMVELYDIYIDVKTLNEFPMSSNLFSFQSSDIYDKYLSNESFEDILNSIIYSFGLHIQRKKNEH